MQVFKLQITVMKIHYQILREECVIRTLFKTRLLLND